MKIQGKKAWVAVVGLALAASTVSGIAAAVEDPATWYSGGNATVADPHRTDATVKLYDGTGAEVTTGSTSAPLASFAAASGLVREGDTYASLFVHLPQSDTAPGAWPGVQVTGTDLYSGGGAVTAPAALAGKPYVRTTSDGYTLADVVAALPNDETGESFAGVYELRLRTSSATKGVSTEYAAGWVKVSGSSWTVTTAPVLGDSEPDPDPVATSVAVTWPSKLTYGTAATVKVTVTAASGDTKPSGTVKLLNGTTTLGTGTLSSLGVANIALSKTALVPGSRTLKVTYAGVADAFEASQSAAKTFVVAKRAPGRPTFKLTKRPTPKKTGTATVAVPTSSGLATATGKVQVVLKKGAKTIKVSATLKSGKASVKLPRLAKGTWTVTVTYPGSSYYSAATSAATKVKSA